MKIEASKYEIEIFVKMFIFLFSSSVFLNLYYLQSFPFNIILGILALFSVFGFTKYTHYLIQRCICGGYP